MLFRRKQPDLFDPPSRLGSILAAPMKYLARVIYRFSNILRSPPGAKNPPVRLVCISDTHCSTPDDIPSGDVLIHAGDLTQKGTIAELQAQIDWMDSLPHPYKIAIAGNHDTWLDPRARQTLDEADRNGTLNWRGIQYLQHSSTTLTFKSQGRTRYIKVYGAPQIPLCGGSDFAFQYPRGQDAWSESIPADTSILVTHSPPKYHRDMAQIPLGCEWLLKEVWRVKPKLHIFGHIHVGAGRERAWWDEAQKEYEAIQASKRKGLILGILDTSAWKALARMVVYGAIGVAWDRVWGGETSSTLFVNAALMYNNTGVVSNPVQVVDL
ncbi:Metallo-dependent phosphatase [Trichodelitschia bisporula]|uniref:Metallo-dependent phosphatase n=1 Tax=Trichodelitschia bisporula TaxID=703511 RepID=A0A6G1HR51_9PEZI|nr:Metallo-dependent phosphatase [Trichodelitschia bisporula]